MSATRHPARAMLLAQHLRKPPLKLGVEATRSELARAGFVVSYNTVRMWTEPAFRARQLELKQKADRERRARNSPLRVTQQAGPEWKLARMRALREAGLSYAAVGKVMGIDFPDDEPLTEAMVKCRLAAGRMIPVTGMGRRSERSREEIRRNPRLTPVLTA